MNLIDIIWKIDTLILLILLNFVDTLWIRIFALFGIAWYIILVDMDRW